MKLVNYNLVEAVEQFSEKRIVFFGAGRWLSTINHTELMKLKKRFEYIVDNGNINRFILGDVELQVYSPNKLINEKNIVIIISSPVYMYDMYTQLVSMKLDDSILCCFFPFMQMITDNDIDKNLLNEVVDDTKEKKIPKIIHSFWFSGDEKPYLYQKCVDSWTNVLTDYEIIEWNMDNYNWKKHPFVECAIRNKAWAYASDYARLDVLNEYGGIYLDMDVEVFKPFDNLLANDAILSFSNHVQVDLAVIGSKRNNVLVDSLLNVYDSLELPSDKRGFDKYFQPALVREKLVENGIVMDGSLQKNELATAFPPAFFMPLDAVMYKEYEKTTNTYCVHYDNFGWSSGKENNKEKKMRDNRVLWNMIDGNAV